MITFGSRRRGERITGARPVMAKTRGARSRVHTENLSLANIRAVHTNNLHSPARVVVTAVAVSPAGRPQGLSVVNERPKIIRMTTTGRLQHRYDHRLRDLVHATGDVSIATNLGVPRSTARGWLGKAATVVVSVDLTNRTASELQREVLELRRRVKRLTALLRLALALVRSSGFRLTHERVPDGCAKIRIL